MDITTKKTIQEVLSELFKQLEIEGDFEVSAEEGAITVLLNTKDMGVVIGYHGEILDSLQSVASLIISKKLGEFTRITMEAGDYRKNRTEYLTSLAERTKEQVLSENREVSLPSLKPWERRVIHLLLQDDPEVLSESIGEGRDRTLVVKPR